MLLILKVFACVKRVFDSERKLLILREWLTPCLIGSRIFGFGPPVGVFRLGSSKRGDILATPVCLAKCYFKVIFPISDFRVTECQLLRGPTNSDGGLASVYAGPVTPTRSEQRLWVQSPQCEHFCFRFPLFSLCFHR